MVKNYILEAQRIIVHLFVCMYTVAVLLLYYTDVPCLYCLTLYITSMNVLHIEHDYTGTGNGTSLFGVRCVCY